MPVIHPIWFYLMSVCNTVKMIAIFLVFATTLLVITCMICADEGDREGEAFRKRFWKRSVAGLCVSLAVSVLCPSCKTLEKMLIAQNVTYERVEQATDVVSSVYEDIMNLFESEAK